MIRRFDERLHSIRDDADVVSAVLAAGDLAVAVELSPADKARVMTAVSELAGNMLKYSNGGRLRLARVAGPSGTGVEAYASDDGPGIADISAALRDHYSTGGTLGLGLPGVKRMMDEFEIDSAPGRGTRVLIRRWKT